MARTAFAPAKVNLFLHVGPPGADGYHPLCSLMVFADIGDRVSAAPADAVSLQVDGPFARQAPASPANLVMRAAQALLSRVRRPVEPFSLRLDKQLPVAAGLGGGSSDAGAVLRILPQQLGIAIGDGDLEAIAAELGADGAACLWGRPVLAEGRGERMSPAPRLPALDAVLVNPGVPVSTPAVYRRLDEIGRFGEAAPPGVPDSFESPQEVAAWLSLQRNDLEAPAIAVEPAVGLVLETLAGERETLLARVSGSGGTCFALCGSDIEAETLAERLEAMAPHWWIRRCRLGGPWPDEG
jgi:4-diphosphocytidyl-2-C-methyl-D-erythritol kinase